MLLEAKRPKRAESVDRKNLLRRAIGEKRDRDRDQPPHQVRVAVAAIVEDRPAIAVDLPLALQPDLTDAAPHLIDVTVRGLVERFKRVAKLNDIAIAILPLV